MRNITLVVIHFLTIFCTTIICGQNQSRNQIYKEIQDTDRAEMYSMLEFLIENEHDFTTNTDINYLSEIVYKKSQAFFGLDKLYLKDAYNTEAYLFYATSSHSSTYIMLYNENEILFLGKDNFQNDMNSLLNFIDKNINEKVRFEFFRKVSKIFIYMIEWNYKLE